MVVMKRWSVALVILVAAFLNSPNAQAPAPAGVLTLLWGDPVDAPGTPQFQILLAMDNGNSVQLEFDPGAEPAFDVLHRLNGRRVTTTSAFVTAGAAGDQQVLHVQSLRLASGEHISAAEQPAPLTGAQPWITLRCKFADFTNEPAINTGLLFGTGYPSPEEFWQETSYGNITLAGSALGPWVTLPQARAAYFFSSGSANLTMLINDCTAASDSSVNFNNFSGISQMFNQPLDGFWWGGSRSMTLDGTTKVFRTVWAGLQPGNPIFLSTLMHEYGHGFGFPHSSGPYGQVYDSRWDVMSYAHVHYDSSVGDYVNEGTISYHKDLDGWIPANRKYLATRNSTATITLERLVAPTTGNYLMAQIPWPGSTTRFYTVELRQQVGHDQWVPGNAVIIHDVHGGAYVVDPDNNGNVNDAGAMWTAGETFTDAANQISVRVNSLSGQFASVTITSGNPAVRRAPSDFDGDGASDLSVYRPADRAWLLRYSSTGGGLAVTWGEPEDIPVPADYDGDNRSDIAVFRPTNGTWYISRSTLGPIAVAFGIGSDLPVPADYDGDGKADLAVFRPSTASWFAIQSGTGTNIGVQFGAPGDLPAPADYDGDGKADFAVFRRSIANWFVMKSTGGTTSAAIGTALDIPVAGDYDGDGLADRAVFQPNSGSWIILRTAGGTLGMGWGQYGDIPVPGDYDADGRTDIAIFRPSTANWHINFSSTGGGLALGWGQAADVIVPADYGVDHKADVAVFRPTNGTWYVLDSAGGAPTTQWGGPGDVPVPADYDGDLRSDVAIYRPSNGTWYILKSGGGTTTTQWGSATDRPVPADYDGDGKADIAIYRPSTSTWYIIRSGGGTTTQTWGTSADIPVPADYNGDNKADIVTYRPATGQWVMFLSNGTTSTQTWGNALDVPVPADYDADGKADIAVYRPSEGNWYVLKAAGGTITTQWGGVRDVPLTVDFDADNKADIAVFRAATATWYILKSGGGTTVVSWGGSADVPLLKR